MHTRKDKYGPRGLILRGCAAALTVALLSACSGWEPIDYHETSNIPQGSGLVSGEKGGWTIFRVKEKKRKPESEETAEGELPGGEMADDAEK